MKRIRLVLKLYIIINTCMVSSSCTCVRIRICCFSLKFFCAFCMHYVSQGQFRLFCGYFCVLSSDSGIKWTEILGSNLLRNFSHFGARSFIEANKRCYRSMLIAMERSCRRLTSVRPSVCPSVTLVIPDHICWARWNFITRLISPVSSLAVCKISAI